MTWKIVLTSTTKQALLRVTDRRVRDKLVERIDALAHDPEKQGKPLLGELKGFRSVRAVGQRWRILYKVEKSQILVAVVALGLRKEGDSRDVYALMKKIVKMGLLEE